MGNPEKMLKVAEIRQWRDKFLLKLEVDLEAHFSELERAFNEAINMEKFYHYFKELPKRKYPSMLKILNKDTLEPIVDSWCKKNVYTILHEAKAQLSKRHSSTRIAIGKTSEFSVDSPTASLLSAPAETALKTGAVGGVAGATLLFSTTTTTAWFGLITITTISWPVVIIGSGLTLTALFIAIKSGYSMPDRILKKIQKTFIEEYRYSILDGSQSLRKQYQTAISEICNELTTELMEHQ